MRKWVWLMALALKVHASDRLQLPPHHHAVEVQIPPKMTVKAPLTRPSDQMLKCPVCHGLKDIDRRPLEEIDAQVKALPEFLHGGPYADLKQFCAYCHDLEEHKRPNIHAMLDAQGRIRTSRCLYCHKVKLDRSQAKSLSEVKLRAPVESLCFGCHLKAPHWNALPHQVKPSKKIKAQLDRYLQENPEVILPLSPEGKVTCVTCHTPHPAGVLAKDLPAANQVVGDIEKGAVYLSHPWAEVVSRDKAKRLKRLLQKGVLTRPYVLEYRQIAEEVLLRLPAKNGQLCRACHAFDE